MVNHIYSVFSSRFNASIDRKSKSFVLPKTIITTRLLNLFHFQGYIFNYQTFNNYNYIVYINHGATPFRLQNAYYTPRFSDFKLRAISNSGYLYIMNTSFGFQFSDTVMITKINGKPIFKIIYF
jgi:hypothetical protein